MTFRENMADWISGGKLTIANRNAALNEKHRAYAEHVARDAVWYIESIRNYVSSQKSGTAKKITRMCDEALNR